MVGEGFPDGQGSIRLLGDDEPGQGMGIGEARQGHRPVDARECRGVEAGRPDRTARARGVDRGRARRLVMWLRGSSHEISSPGIVEEWTAGTAGLRLGVARERARFQIGRAHV